MVPLLLVLAVRLQVQHKVASDLSWWYAKLKKQKDIFLEGEADAWFERNQAAIERCQLDATSDPVIRAVDRCLSPVRAPGMRLLEIGCGGGKRLQAIKNTLGISCHGLEPSPRAVAIARSRGVDAQVGTAERLPFGDRQFDFVVFGFCLYLCDREDLFRIAEEADRVLKRDSWLIIHDFYSPTPRSRNYHHRQGVYSYKMDYRNLFCWHPAYECYSHELLHHSTREYTDDAEEWVGLSVIRKKADR